MKIWEIKHFLLINTLNKRPYGHVIIDVNADILEKNEKSKF